jgi:sucrose-6-phosphate hydrolase SacC (GH32 family)
MTGANPHRFKSAPQHQNAALLPHRQQRVFIDRSVVEVFVNDRQYLAMRVYPGRQDSLGVSLQARGQNAVLKSLDAWQMKAIWP